MITVASRCEAAFWSWGNSTDNSTDCLPVAVLTSLRSVEVIIFCKQGRVAAEKNAFIPVFIHAQKSVHSYHR